MADKITTLILEPEDYSPMAIAVYQKLGPVYKWPEIEKKEKERKQILNSVNTLVVRLGHKIDKNWMDKMPALRVIATPTTGLNHIDLEYAKQKDIRIISLRGRTSFLKFIPSTAEETWALILSLVRNMPWAHIHTANVGWNRDLFKGHQLLGKTLGIVGFGRLGHIVAKYGKAFGMNVVFYDPYKKATAGVKKLASLDQLFNISDIVSVHAIYDPNTTHRLIKREHLNLMKPSAYFINTARGEIVDERALLDVLRNKKIAGAALDVMTGESQGGGHLLGVDSTGAAFRGYIQHQTEHYGKDSSKSHGLPHVLIVPHLGGATYEAMAVTEDFIADLVFKYFKKKNK